MTLDRDNLARQLANHGTDGVEDIDPDVEDYRFADYLIRNAYRVHGYHTLARRITRGLVVALAILIFVLILAQAQGAH